MRVTRALVLISFGLGACSSDFDPASYLKGLRVLAITSDRLEAGPGEAVRLRPVLHVPAGAAAPMARWSFCPLSLGAASAYRCVAPACETALPTDAEGGTTATPGALAAACYAALAADGGAPLQDGGLLAGGGGAGGGPLVLDSVFRLRLDDGDGGLAEAVQRFPLYPLAAPPNRNRAPVITGVTMAGVAPDASGRFPAQSAVTPLQEVAVAVTLDGASLDAYTDSAGVSYTEEPVVSFYATAGRFQQDRAGGLRGSVQWKADKLLPGDTEALLYVVARDLRGGETVAGPYRFAITR